jgi:penicillin-binding protein 1A
MAEWDGNPMPRAGLRGEQAMDARTAFQIMYMLEGVIQRGTATILRDLNLPLFGKTGTTTGPKDVWFIGGTQRMIAGTYIGFDKPRNMGGYAFGGTISAPIFKDFVQKTRDRWTAEPPIAPPGIRMVRVDRRTGKKVMTGWPSNDGNSAIIWEAFKPDTEPEAWNRRDEIKAKRDEILSLIRKTRSAASKKEESSQGSDRQESFVEEQGGIY